MPVKIGYLIPEFPGQTHIFFWRERQELSRLGVDAELVSTRHPPRKLISHDWAQQAIAQTLYLHPLSAGGMVGAVGEVLRSGPGAWGRCLRAILGAEMPSMGKRVRLGGLMLFGALLARVARGRGWGHIQCHSCGDAAHIALFAHLLSGIPYSITLHGPLGDYGPNQGMKWRHSAFAVVITRKLLGEVKDRIGKDLPGVVEVAGMGVELRHFARSGPYRAWDGTGRARIFSCGRLNPCKGHDDLIRAVGLLAQTMDVELHIAGEDDSEDGSHRAGLKRLIDELKLGDRVKLLGAVSELKVREELETSHIFALASLHEPLGVAIMEAMAMEVPVVVTGAGGVPELVEHGAEGWLVEPRKPGEMAEAIEKVLRDPGLACRLGAAGREKVISHYDSSVSAKAIVRNIHQGGGR